MSQQKSLGNRIVVVGANGSGKTTFAKRLSAELHLPHFELDSLFWLPDWGELSNEQFREKENEITEGEKWIIDGNYARNQDITIGKADSVVWLNYRMSLSMYRVVKRSLFRIYTKEPLWHNNMENLRRVFSPKDSIILFAFKSFKRKNARYEKMMTLEDLKNVNWVRIKNKKEELKFWNEV